MRLPETTLPWDSAPLICDPDDIAGDQIARSGGGAADRVARPGIDVLEVKPGSLVDQDTDLLDQC